MQLAVAIATALRLALVLHRRDEIDQFLEERRWDVAQHGCDSSRHLLLELLQSRVHAAELLLIRCRPDEVAREAAHAAFVIAITRDENLTAFRRQLL